MEPRIILFQHVVYLFIMTPLPAVYVSPRSDSAIYKGCFSKKKSLPYCIMDSDPFVLIMNSGPLVYGRIMLGMSIHLSKLPPYFMLWQ